MGKKYKSFRNRVAGVLMRNANHARKNVDISPTINEEWIRVWAIAADIGEEIGDREGFLRLCGLPTTHPRHLEPPKSPGDVTPESAWMLPPVKS